MKDKELRKLIGSRAKQRRLELGLKQLYVAEKMGVTASTIQRYEAGTIDNTKKLVLDGLSEALHVSVEWLKGVRKGDISVDGLPEIEQEAKEAASQFQIRSNPKRNNRF